jgi:hypothetical protein
MTPIITPTSVGHCRREPYLSIPETNKVYIGRNMPRFGLKNLGWGNPFKLGYSLPCDATLAITKYRAWLFSQEDLLARLPELQGKVLGCWCKDPDKPKKHNAPCHGDVLAELANASPDIVRIERYIAIGTQKHCHTPIWSIIENLGIDEVSIRPMILDLLHRNIIVESLDYCFKHVPTMALRGEV